jgi:hypothetical protein
MRPLVKILLVILVGGIILGLTVIIAVKTREAAARSTCLNNLRQIGFSLRQYQDCYKHFPAPTLPNPDLPTERRLSWLLAVMPFVESNNIYSSTDRTKAWDDEENRRIALIPINIYCCPANAQRRAATREALTHFVGIAGVGPDAASLPLGHPRAGLFGHERVTRHKRAGEPSFGIRLGDIKDGESTTLIAAETNWANGPWVAGGPATVRGLIPHGRPYLGEGGQFGSGHGQGSHVLFVDASVRFLPDSVNPKLFEAMATIAGREDVSRFEEE